MEPRKIYVSYLWTLCFLFVLSSCSTQKTSKGDKETTEKTKVEVTTPKVSGGPVWVVKPDGSKSCGMKKGTPAKQMLQELEAAGIKAIKHKMGHDGKPRMMVCGADTGNQMEVLISEESLDTAQEKGFRLKSGD